LGGFVFYADYFYENYFEKFDQFTTDKVVDDKISSIVIDFVLYNPHLNFMSFVSLDFVFIPGGTVYTHQEVVPFRQELYSTPIDHFRAFLEF
jgi:hypothetical protein